MKKHGHRRDREREREMGGWEDGLCRVCECARARARADVCVCNAVHRTSRSRMEAEEREGGEG